MKKRLVALLMALMLALQMAEPVQATQTVYFTAINDNVLPLTDASMPFWKEGYLYVDSSIFTMADNAPGKPLEIYRSRNDAKQILVLSSDGRSLIFDLAAGTVEDNQGARYYPGSVRRGNEVFVPVSLVAYFFNLTYSNIRVDMDGSYHGYLVWIRNDKAALTDDKTFANAATYQMELKYAQYLKSQEDEDSNQLPWTGGEDADPGGKTLYLCIQAVDPELTGKLLDALDGDDAKATFYMSPEFMEAQGGLLRRMSATGHGIGILADAEDSAAVLEQLERGNRALSLATCGKTRLVRLNEETEKTVRDDVEAAGYCCLEEKLDRSRYNLSSVANANALLQRVVNYRGPVSIWLADRVNAAGLRAFLTVAGQVDDRCRVLTEIT